jgi:uncharacterized protein YjeT (DUF2065 family)
MVVFIMVALNGLFLFGNGLFMLVVPSAWYHFVPGVTHTDPFNQHFTRDIGFIQMLLGAAFGIGMIRPLGVREQSATKQQTRFVRPLVFLGVERTDGKSSQF